MLCFRSRAIRPTRSSPRSLRTTLPPSGRGSPVCVVPPLAEVDDLVQAALAVIELPLVDDQAGLDPSLGDGREDLVERHDDDRHVLAQAELERQVRGRELARHGDRPAPQVVERRRLAGDQVGPYRSPMLEPEASSA